MFASISRADITPEVGAPLQGHFNTRPSHSVLRPLEVRVLMLRSDGQSACIATIDAIGVATGLRARFRATLESQWGIKPECVMLVASHTHCAPPVLPSLGMQPDVSFCEAIEQALHRCASEALDRLEPVTLGLGCGSVHFNVNRRLPVTAEMGVNCAGIVDPRARILRIDRADGSPLAILFHYSCHPTAKSGTEGVISPDYPGLARESIEDALGCTALFLPGCCANIRPMVLDAAGRFCSADDRTVELLGRQLGRVVCEAAGGIRTHPASRLIAREAPIRLRFGKTRSIEQLQKMAADSSELGRCVFGPWARRLIQSLESGAVPDAETSLMQSMRIGPMMLVAIPGEPAQEIGHAIERELAGIASVSEIWPVGYANDMLGYLCTPEQICEGGYEPQAYAYYDRPAPFDGESAEILKTAQRLAAGQ